MEFNATKGFALVIIVFSVFYSNALVQKHHSNP